MYGTKWRVRPTPILVKSSESVSKKSNSSGLTDVIPGKHEVKLVQIDCRLVTADTPTEASNKWLCLLSSLVGNHIGWQDCFRAIVIPNCSVEQFGVGFWCTKATAMTMTAGETQTDLW